VVALRFESLSSKHDRGAFECGAPALDGWFRTRATQDERRNVARIFVALDDHGIVGFYSLSMFTLALDDLPPELADKLPKYKALPAALIGRLARHVRARGQGVGELLLADAITRVLGVAQSVAAFAIVVDAKDDAAIAFYRTFGFIQFPSSPSRLFLPAKSAAAALEAARGK
jgi:ribosomal protein S18 acetylase RimI-like enzyme